MDGSYVGFQRGSAVCSLLLGFSQDLQRRWIARSSTLCFFINSLFGIADEKEKCYETDCSLFVDVNNVFVCSRGTK